MLRRSDSRKSASVGSEKPLARSLSHLYECDFYSLIYDFSLLILLLLGIAHFPYDLTSPARLRHLANPLALAMVSPSHLFEAKHNPSSPRNSTNLSSPRTTSSNPTRQQVRSASRSHHNFQTGERLPTMMQYQMSLTRLVSCLQRLESKRIYMHTTWMIAELY